jgi:hypothetical protein
MDPMVLQLVAHAKLFVTCSERAVRKGGVDPDSVINAIK